MKEKEKDKEKEMEKLWNDCCWNVYAPPFHPGPLHHKMHGILVQTKGSHHKMLGNSVPTKGSPNVRQGNPFQTKMKNKSGNIVDVIAYPAGSRVLLLPQRDPGGGAKPPPVMKTMKKVRKTKST